MMVATVSRTTVNRVGAAHELARTQWRRRRQIITQPRASTASAAKVSHVLWPANHAVPARLRPASDKAIGSTQHEIQASRAAPAPTAAAQPTAASAVPRGRRSLPNDIQTSVALDEIGRAHV